MHFIIEFSNGIVQLSSVYNICAIKSMIVLEMKCPQLSKPEATAARNGNNNQKCFLSSKSVYYNDFWRSCDTEDRSNDAENTALISEINYI